MRQRKVFGGDALHIVCPESNLHARVSRHDLGVVILLISQQGQLGKELGGGHEAVKHPGFANAAVGAVPMPVVELAQSLCNLLAVQRHAHIGLVKGYRRGGHVVRGCGDDFWASQTMAGKANIQVKASAAMCSGVRSSAAAPSSAPAM